MWAIFNINGQWGRETYPTKEAAQAELRAFWKGVTGVNLKKFSIREILEAAALESLQARALESRHHQRKYRRARAALKAAEVI